MARAFFIVEPSGVSTEAAEKFGERVFLFTEFVNPFSVEKLMRETKERLELAEYDPDTDYIVLTGPCIHVSLFVGLVLLEWSRAKLLLFDAPNSDYKERNIREGIFAG